MQVRGPNLTACMPVPSKLLVTKKRGAGTVDSCSTHSYILIDSMRFKPFITLNTLLGWLMSSLVMSPYLSMTYSDFSGVTDHPQDMSTKYGQNCTSEMRKKTEHSSGSFCFLSAYCNCKILKCDVKFVFSNQCFVCLYYGQTKI